MRTNHAGESRLGAAVICGAGWTEGKGIQQLEFTEVLDTDITLILIRSVHGVTAEKHSRGKGSLTGAKQTQGSRSGIRIQV